MSATILLGPAAGGKTQRLVEILVGAAGEIQPRWAVVPDRTQVSGFRRRLAEAGGALGVNVGTFADLFQEILERARRPVAVMPEPARQRLLRLVLQQLEAQGQLPYYRPIVGTPGFLEAVAGAISEFKRALAAPAAVAALAGRADMGNRIPEAVDSGLPLAAQSEDGLARGRALGELAAIYGAYQQRLAEIPWTDREGLAELAVEALVTRPDLLADMLLIAVDGFDSFDAGQLEGLRALAAQPPQLVIALTGGTDTERIAYRRLARTLERLRTALPDAVIEVPPSAGDGAAVDRDSHSTPPPMAPSAPARPAEPLSGLAAGLFERESPMVEAGEAIQMIEARGPAEEAREAIRWLKARLIRDQYQPDECAVIAADPAAYGPLLRRAADEFGLQLRFSLGEPLSRAPAVAALMELLELGRSNWPRRLTLQTVRSPFFELAVWGFAAEDALALDAASYAGQVVEGLDQWTEALEQLASLTPGTIDDGSAVEELADEPTAFAPPVGAAAARLLDALKALAKRLDPVRPRSTAEWVAWLEDLLDELDFGDQIAAGIEPEREANPEHAAIEQLRETLRALVMSEAVVSAKGLDFPEFLDELRISVEATHFQARHSGPAIDVLGTPATWGGRYRAVVVMGLSEGLLPVVEREDPFLDESARAELGLEPRLGREQAGLFYQAVTRADERLLLTRPYLADDGEVWEPSPYWSAVAELTNLQPRRLRPEEPRPLQEAGSTQELLFLGVRRGGMPDSLLAPHHLRWQRLQQAREVLEARTAEPPEGPNEGGLYAVAELLAERFDKNHLWSPSRLESYGTCPHMFYASYLLGLELREPPKAGLNAAQLGTMLHEILELAYAEAEAPNQVESVLAALDRVAGPIMDAAPQRHGFRPTALWAIEREQFSEALRETVRALAEHSAEWTPVGLELRFGIGDQPALELELEGNGRQLVRVRGVIDRLDRNADGDLFVIDYKTGSSGLTPSELSRGRRIQLPLYSLAAQQALGLGTVVNGSYWSILKAKAGSLQLKRYRPAEPPSAAPPVGPEAAYAVARSHVSRIVGGVRSGAFPPVPPAGGCPEYCPAASWCWRYRPSRFA